MPTEEWFNQHCFVYAKSPGDCLKEFGARSSLGGSYAATEVNRLHKDLITQCSKNILRVELVVIVSGDHAL